MSRLTAPPLLLVALFVATPATQGQTPKTAEKVSLEQAVEKLSQKAAGLAADVAKQTETLVKAQTRSGATSAVAMAARASLIKLQQKKADATLDHLRLLAFQRRLGDAGDETKTIEGWLEQAKQPVPLPEPATPAPTAYNYTSIDKYVRATPKQAEESVEALGAYLAKGARNDREKARAVFLWVAENLSYDLDGVAARKVERRPAEVLKSRCTDCGGHAELVQALGKAAGLEVVEVVGHVRDLSPNPVFQFATQTSATGTPYVGHAWNAVKIDDTWYLLDATFADGRKKKDGKVEEKHPTQLSFFLTPPQHLISSHFPADPKWQLLMTPRTKKEQENLPLLHASFHTLGLKLDSHQGLIAPAKQELLLTLQAPRDLTVLAHVYQDGKELENEPVLVGRQGARVELHAVFQRAGTYALRVYAGKSGSTKKKECELVAEYRVEADPGSEPLPALSGSFPTWAEKECRLYAPQSGTLQARQSNQFLVLVPGAVSVSVRQGEDSMKLVPVAPGLFAGDVRPPAGEVTLAAVFPTQPKLAYHLLKYKAE